MKRILLLLCFYLITSTWCQAQTNYFQQRVDNLIDVSLNDKEHTLDGFIKIEYTNNSADTLTYIWFHLWPNAFKNDRTAFSDQKLKEGSTDFYFSNNDQQGYINRLDFKVNGITARLEDHPEHIDIAKVVLPLLLLPGKKITITTPFHVKLPYNFSRGGHVGQSYQVTQWFPKPAVYDRKGWHPIPYLDQGEYYSEFGNYVVQITVPKEYVVAATGEAGPQTSSSEESKTLRYTQDNIHDFAWFADKKYLTQSDTLKLASGRVIKAFSYYLPGEKSAWKNSVGYIKDAVRTRSLWLGEYPYNVVSAVEGPMGFNGGMEYPTITILSPGMSETGLDKTIEHEVGHNWNYGILASNERDHPWMDEGINMYYDGRYVKWKYPDAPLVSINTGSTFLQKRFPKDPVDLVYRTILATKNDQPISTPSEKFNVVNYNLIAYYKTGEWMKLIEKDLGQEVLDRGMQEFFRRWKFKHPYPEDLKATLEEISGKNLDQQFILLDKTGPLEVMAKQNKPVKFVTFAGVAETDKYNYIFTGPALGFNFYDHLMLGIFLHNYTLPLDKFRFFVTPMYATGSKKLTGLARISHAWFSYGPLQKIELSFSAAKFTTDIFTDSTGKNNYLGFRKLAPSLRVTFRQKDPTNAISSFVQWKTFFIEEDELLFRRGPVTQVETISYPKIWRYLNQVKLVMNNDRKLYPYNGELQVEQAEDFVRTTFTGNYFFNYSKGGGLSLRLFAGKLFYMGDKTSLKRFETDRYHLNMTGPRGYEDYTYSNYFVGRNEFDGFRSQQILIRDGGFKVRTDLLASKIGKTDDWLTAANLKTNLPKNINPLSLLPIKIPLKVFLDVGTYSEAWKKNSATGKFVYDAGLQLSVLGDVVNIYIPVLYSKVYGDYFKSTITGSRFLKNISFSIDIQNFNIRKYINQIQL